MRGRRTPGQREGDEAPSSNSRKSKAATGKVPRSSDRKASRFPCGAPPSTGKARVAPARKRRAAPARPAAVAKNGFTAAAASSAPPPVAEAPRSEAGGDFSEAIRASAAKVLLSAAVQLQRLKKGADAATAKAVTSSGLATSGEISDLARRSARLARRIRHLAEALERRSDVKKP